VDQSGGASPCGGCVNLKGVKVLVTGGAGFIGSHVVEDLLHHGAEVRVFDNFSTGHRENLGGVSSEVEIVVGDILHFEALLKACHGCDVISHHAAQLEITKCIENPIHDLRINTEGTINVLECARRLGVKKVVYASSACVYGQAEALPQREDHGLNPNWPYGVSKLAAEHYARLVGENFELSTAGLRYSIVYGPREWFGRVLTVFLRRALSGEPPVIWGGDQQRDFVFVKDVARLHTLCVADGGGGSELFNVSTGRGTTIRCLAELVCSRFGLTEPIEEAVGEGQQSTLIEGRIRLPAELKQMVLDSSKAQARFGWVPETDLTTGLTQEMEWLVENQGRWSRMHY